MMSRSSQRGQMGSHQKPAFKPPSRAPIPDLSSMPAFQERHARLCSKLRRSQSTVDLSTPSHDRHAACKMPRSASKDSPGRPAWDDRTQIVYPRPGFEFLMRPFGSFRKKAKAGKKDKEVKCLVESETKKKGDSRATPESRRRVLWFSSVPDLTLVASEPSSPDASQDETCETGGTGMTESLLERILHRMKIQKQLARKKQDLKDMCKSLDILPLPKDDSAESQVGGLSLLEEHLKKTKSKPEPQSSSKGLFSRATKQACPGKPSQLEVVLQEQGKVHLKWCKPEDDGGRPVLRYTVEQKHDRSANWVEALKTPGPECEATVTGLTDNCVVQFRVRAVNKGSVGEPSDPIDCRVAAQGARPKEQRKGMAASMERHLKMPRFSPRPNKPVKEVEKKAPVKRNILSSLSNVSRQPRENSTKLGGSRLRRAASTLSVMGAGSTRKPKASTTDKQAAQPSSSNKENKQKGAAYNLLRARAFDNL